MCTLPEPTKVVPELMSIFFKVQRFVEANFVLIGLLAITAVLSLPVLFAAGM